jgi:hypothetical protein
MFLNLKPGDIIFVRGNAKIIDTCIITEEAFYDSEGHYKNDYFLKIPFLPLFSNIQTVINTLEIPKSIYTEVLYDGGRSLPLRSVSERSAKVLFSKLIH